MFNVNPDKHTKLLIVGDTDVLVEEIFPHLDPMDEEQVTYLDGLEDLMVEADLNNVDAAVDTLIYHVKRGAVIWLAREPYAAERPVLRKLDKMRPQAIYDEALEALLAQDPAAITAPEDFESAVWDALDQFNVEREKVLFMEDFDSPDTRIGFYAPNRLSQMHTIEWCADGVIELDGIILRHTAVMAQGHFKRSLIGDRILTPAEVVGFIAKRLAISGIEELLGFGKAFGPSKEDKANAALTTTGRDFRANAVLGVVSAKQSLVTRAKFDAVEEVANEMHRKDPDLFVLPHQMMLEIYFGVKAAKLFRAERLEDGRWKLPFKSSKHGRVDTGAFCLHTVEDGYVSFPAVIGNFEESNDGMAYMPLTMLEGISGWVKESVKAVRDFAQMTPELVSRYFETEMHVKDGDTVMPGDLLFTVGGIPHHWETKADWGTVTAVIDEMSTKLVRVEVRIDAHFEGEMKMRGFGKALFGPMEACGVSLRIKGDRKKTHRALIGGPGVIKDGLAAQQYMTDVKRVTASVTSEFCERNYELHKQKHQPEPKGKGKTPTKWEKVYKNQGITMMWDDKTRTVTTTDTNAIACTVKAMIEAAPVAQSVGTSAMTLPQMAWLSSLEAGNAWLKQQALPGMIKRTNALAYLHAVANRVPVETRD